jgi:hypothetical protein
MRRWLPAAVAALAITATAVFHGLWLGRWQEASAAGATTEALEQIPMRLGDWEGQSLELNSRETRDYSGVLYRRYVNTQTGVTVAVVLVAGHPKDVSIHSPDYCYPASGFDRTTWAPCAVTFDKQAPPAQFKTALLTKTQASGQMHVRVLWSWYASGTWSVPNDPRWTFTREPQLYKLHVVRETSSGSEAIDGDPCLDLLRQLLASFQERVAARRD